MASAVTLVIYTAVALLLLLLLSSHSHGPHHHRHRRLKLRPSTGGRHIPFDPIISDLEHRRQDREWEKSRFEIPHHDPAPGHESQPQWEDFAAAEAEDYLNDDDRFNVTHRIELLFPQIDVGPADGFVTSDELTDWNLQQAAREVMHRTERDMELYDKNHDGFVSFHEYEPPSWVRNLQDNNSSDYKMGWWREDHFNASDVDGNGLLNKTEFNDFLHPADSNNPKLIHWLCKEEIRDRDKDKDGKLGYLEYYHRLFNSIWNHDEDHNQTSTDAPAKNLFAKLDQDNDGFLTEDELKPVIGNIHPTERFYAKQQADYSISQADADNDGRLSLKEMIERPYVFYTAIFSDDDDNAYPDEHDEFR